MGRLPEFCFLHWRHGASCRKHVHMARRGGYICVLTLSLFENKLENLLLKEIDSKETKPSGGMRGMRHRASSLAVCKVFSQLQPNWHSQLKWLSKSLIKCFWKPDSNLTLPQINSNRGHSEVDGVNLGQQITFSRESKKYH